MDGANAASAVSTQNSSLGRRLISALVLIPLILGLVWLNYWVVAVGLIAVAVICVRELYSAFIVGGFRPRMLVGATIVTLICGAAASIPLLALPFSPFVPALLLSVVVALSNEIRYHHQEAVLVSWALTFAGAVYVGMTLSHLTLIRAIAQPPLQQGLMFGPASEPGVAWFFFVLVVTWFQDSAAYFVGKRFGRHKMAPILSPKKTWEGAVGGVIGAVLGAVMCIPLLGLPITWPVAVVLGLVGAVAGPLGDLSESMIKRQIGIKDTGNAIPGHGGILDRVDSLMYIAPVLYYLIVLLMR